MLLISSCNCLHPICWSQVLSWEWRCSWSSADRRCSNYIWVINNLIAYQSASYIRDLRVIHVTESLGCLLGVLECAAVVTLYLIQCYNKACHSGGHYWDYSTILVPYYYVKSLQLIGGSGTSNFRCRDLTTPQGTRIVAPDMAARLTRHTDHSLIRTDRTYLNDRLLCEDFIPYHNHQSKGHPTTNAYPGYTVLLWKRNRTECFQYVYS